MRGFERAWFAPRYYGWVVLTTVSITEVLSWGTLYYAYSVFLAPMHAELGWSPVALSGAYSAMILASGLAAVPVGRWLDQHGPRALMSAGSILATLLLVAWSQVTTLWVFYLIMIGVGLASAAVLYEPAFVIVATWFRRKRGRALTVLTFFGAWASFIFVPLSQTLVTWLGWRTALLALAALLGSVTIPLHALVLRRRPADLGLLPDGDPPQPIIDSQPRPNERSVTPRAALRDTYFWWLSFAIAASNMATVVMTLHLITYLTEQGLSAGFAATVAGLFGLMSLSGRLIIGPLGDRFSRLWLTAGLLAMQALGLAIVFLFPSAPGALGYVVLFGAGAGTLTIMRAALMAERYGPAHYGSINGTQNLILTGARTGAPVGAGALATMLGEFRPLVGMLAALALLGSLSLILTATRSARRSDNGWTAG